MTSGGNSFHHFPENQLTMTLHFFASLLGERYCITVPPCPDIISRNAVHHHHFICS